MQIEIQFMNETQTTATFIVNQQLALTDSYEP